MAAENIVKSLQARPLKVYGVVNIRFPLLDAFCARRNVHIEGYQGTANTMIRIVMHCESHVRARAVFTTAVQGCTSAVGTAESASAFGEQGKHLATVGTSEQDS